MKTQKVKVWWKNNKRDIIKSACLLGVAFTASIAGALVATNVTLTKSRIDIIIHPKNEDTPIMSFPDIRGDYLK